MVDNKVNKLKEKKNCSLLVPYIQAESAAAARALKFIIIIFVLTPLPFL